MSELSPTEIRWVRRAEYLSRTSYHGCPWSRAPDVFSALVKRGFGHVDFTANGAGRTTKRFVVGGGNMNGRK